MKPKRKLARNSSSQEIFPGKHGPVRPATVDLMTRVMSALRETFPRHHITLFLGERKSQDGTPPRFNYMSTADRRDMLAVLRAFIERHSEDAENLDKIKDAPPTSSRQ